MAQCNHARKGIITNQPGGYESHDKNRPHASRNSCDREQCIRAGKSAIAATTNETAYYVPDADRSLRL